MTKIGPRANGRSRLLDVDLFRLLSTYHQPDIDLSRLLNTMDRTCAPLLCAADNIMENIAGTGSWCYEKAQSAWLVVWVPVSEMIRSAARRK